MGLRLLGRAKKKKKRRKKEKKKEKKTQRKIGAKINRFSGEEGSDLKVPVPSVGGLESASPRHELQPLASQCRHDGLVTPSWCRQRAVPHATKKPVSNDLQSSSIECIVLDQFHVPHESIRSHSCPCFVTNLRCSALEWKPPSSQNPCLGARCAMVARGSNWRPHRQVRRVKGRGNCVRTGAIRVPDVFSEPP